MTTEKPKDLCAFLRYHGDKITREDKAAQLTKERDFIKSLVGEEYSQQVTFDEQESAWTICGHKFRYSNSSKYNGISSGGALRRYLCEHGRFEDIPSVTSLDSLAQTIKFCDIEVPRLKNKKSFWVRLFDSSDRV